MTAYMPRRRHPKLKIAGLALWAAAATALAVYFAQTVHMPKSVCVSAAKPRSVATAPAPIHHAVDSSRAAGQEAQSVRNIDLSGVEWKPDGGVPLPESAQAGPRDTAGGLASGYADTPLGALIAGMDITARTSWQFGPNVFGPTVANQVTGKFAGQLLSSDQDAWDSGAPESTAATEGTREYAYIFDSYTPSAATLEIVSGVPGAATDADTQIQVVWEHGDWRVVAPPGGDWSNSAAQVSDTAPGFTPFPGQGD